MGNELGVKNYKLGKNRKPKRDYHSEKPDQIPLYFLISIAQSYSSKFPGQLSIFPILPKNYKLLMTINFHMLYTRAGDKGTTKTFACNQRISKSSAVAEALGSLDEVNSFLGLCKVNLKAKNYKLKTLHFSQIVHQIQQNLFIVQAELAGAPKVIEKSKVKEVEALVDTAEKKLPPIKTFFISGGSELAAIFDVSRTMARRAERRVVKVSEEGKIKISADTLAYLNRLSSLLYALARLSNHLAGVKEEPPAYK